MNRRIYFCLFIIALLSLSSCSKEFDTALNSDDYNTLKQGLSRLIDMRSTAHSDIANSLDFNIRAYTKVWTYPDGSLAAIQISKEFIDPLDHFSQELGFASAMEAHEWLVEIGEAIEGLIEEFTPKDHLGFLREITTHILADEGIQGNLTSERGYSCYLFFEQTAYIRYVDFAKMDKHGNTVKSLDGNKAAVYAEGSAIHLLAKMVMVLTSIS